MLPEVLPIGDDEPQPKRRPASPLRKGLWTYWWVFVIALPCVVSCFCCGGAFAWDEFFGWGGVTRSEREMVYRQLNSMREAGFQNEVVVLSYEGAWLTNKWGRKVRVLHVRCFTRKAPEKIADLVYTLTPEGGLRHISEKLPLDDSGDWKKRAMNTYDMEWK
jgi:predicted Fe-S protein YdhL (DUF1289 family)